MSSVPAIREEVLELICDPTDPSKFDGAILKQIQNIVRQSLQRRKTNKKTQRRFRDKQKGILTPELRDEDLPTTPADIKDLRILSQLEQLARTNSFADLDFSCMGGLRKLVESHNNRLQNCRVDQLKYRSKLKTEKEVKDLQGKIQELTLQRDTLRENLFTVDSERLARYHHVAETYSHVVNINHVLDTNKFLGYCVGYFKQGCILTSDFYPRAPTVPCNSSDFLKVASYMKMACPKVQQRFLEFVPNSITKSVRIVEELFLPVDRNFVQMEFPHVLNDEYVMQQLLGKTLHIFRTLTFYFNDKLQVEMSHAETNVASEWARLLDNEALTRFVLKLSNSASLALPQASPYDDTKTKSSSSIEEISHDTCLGEAKSHVTRPPQVTQGTTTSTSTNLLENSIESLLSSESLVLPASEDRWQSS